MLYSNNYLRELIIQLLDVSFFFSSRRRHTRCLSDWSSDVCSSDLPLSTHLTAAIAALAIGAGGAWWTQGQRYGLQLEQRSEERRVGKEGRSRWSPYH